MRLLAPCLVCDEPVQVADLATPGHAECPKGHVQLIDPGAIVDGRVERCPWCGTHDLYVQKDFPERVGIALVVIGLVLATIAWAYYSWIGTFGTLFAFGLADWILFHTRKDVTVCYRCLAQIRDMANHPDRRAFDLAIGERYRQERLRKANMPKE